MTVRTMTHEDLQAVLGWAADEGWNPGIDDARAFLAADPAGFFIKEVRGERVAAISVVNHDQHFAFLGLYLCRPEYRGQGYGMEVWREGIAHAGTRCIGLDGVPDQQSNYALSGFVKHGGVVRYEGSIDAEKVPRVRAATVADIETLIARDMKATGIQRERFSTAWLSQAPTRQTVVLADGTSVKGFATFRQCKRGVKIGPLHASCEEDARALMASNPFEYSRDPVFIDIEGQNAEFAELLEGLGFSPVFETARMYTGAPPQTETAPFHANATMELG